MRTIPPPGPGPEAGETLDQLISDWWVFQLRAGHRFSTDDLLTGWRAAAAMPNAATCLDIGSGIGSVGLYLLGLLAREGNTHATLTTIEAQDVSIALARRSVARNGLQERVTLHHGDLRDPQVLPEGARFQLVTGSPPYVPLGKGLASPHPQRAACRMELRGSVFDYCEAARRWLAPGGRFTYVMAARDDRIEAAPRAAGLTVVERMDVVFRQGDVPMIAVLTCARDEDGPHPDRVDDTLLIRQADGQLSERYAALRASLGFSVA